MATYRITAPDGIDYEIDGPEGATQQQVVAQVKKQIAAEEKAEYDAQMYEQNREVGLGENIMSGLGAGFTGTLESGALGLATLLDEENELGARETIQNIGDRFTPTGGDKDSISYGLANAIGSIGGFAAPGALAALAVPASATAGIAGLVGTGTAAALGVATQAGEASERARDAGATEEQRNSAIRWASPVGVTEVLPLGKMAKLFNKPLFYDLLKQLGPNTLKGIRGRIVNAAATGGMEAAQEVTQELVQNLVEQGYNPSKELMDNLGPAAGYGGGAGAIMQGVLDLFVPHKFRAKNTTDDIENDKLVDKALGLTYDPHEQVRMPDGSTMDVRKGDRAQEQAAGMMEIEQLIAQEEKATSDKQLSAINTLNKRDAAMLPIAERRKEELGAAKEEDELSQLMAEIEQEDAAKAREDAHQATYQKGIATLNQVADTAVNDEMVAEAQAERTAAARRVILDNVLATNKGSTQVATLRNFTKKLTAAKFNNPQATASEIDAIIKAFAEPTVPAVAIPTAAEASQQLKQGMLNEENKKQLDAATAAQLAEQATARPVEVPERNVKNGQPKPVSTAGEGNTDDPAGRGDGSTDTGKDGQSADTDAEPTTPDSDTVNASGSVAGPIVRPEATETTAEGESAALEGEPVVRDYHSKDWMEKTGLDKETIENYGKLGDEQRGGPENQMVATQEVLGGGVLNQAIEHVGDLTNRMSPMHSFGWGYEATLGKIDQQLRTLKHEYGFEKEHRENIENTAKFRKVPLTEHQAAVDKSLKKYADEHRKLPAYNDIQRLARDAAVALGEQRFDDATSMLEELKSRIATPEKFAQELKPETSETKAKPKPKTEADAESPRSLDRDEEDGEASPDDELTDTDTTKLANAIDKLATILDKQTEPDTETAAPKKRTRTAATKATVPIGQTPTSNTTGTETTENTFVTKEERDAIIAKYKGGTSHSIGPEMLADAIKLAAYYIETGARSFAAYSKKMIEAMGEDVRPYLTPAYEAVRESGDIDTKGMSSVDEAKRSPDELTDEQREEVDWLSEALKDKIRVSGDATSEATRNMGINPYLSENPKEVVPVSDYTAVIKLLQRNEKSLKGADKAAYTYFNDDRRVIDNLTDIAYDFSHWLDLEGTTGIQVNKYNRPDIYKAAAGLIEGETEPEHAFRNQKGGPAAQSATQWVRDNLSNDANAELSKKLDSHLKDYVTVLKLDPVTYLSKLSKEEQEEYDKTDKGKAEKKRKEAVEAEKAANKVVYGIAILPNPAATGGRTLTPQEREEYEQNNPERIDEIDTKMEADKIAGEAKNSKDKAAQLKLMKQLEDEASFIDRTQTGEVFKDVSDVFELPWYAIEATSLPMHPKARQLLAAGDLKGALELTGQTASNALVRRFASAIAKNIGDTKVKMVKGLKNNLGRPAGGHFDPKTNTLAINADESVPIHVLIHEASHSVLSHTLDNPSHPLTKKLQTIYDNVKDDLSSYYGTKSLQEFAAEAMGNPRFQQELASLYAGKKSDLPAWRQFLDAVTGFFKKLLKIPKTDAYSQLNNLLEAMMSPAPATRNAGVLYSMGLQGRLDEVVAADKAGRAISDEAMPEIEQNQYAKLGKKILRSLKSNGRLSLSGLMPSYHLADLTETYGIDGAHAVHDSFSKYEAEVERLKEATNVYIVNFNEWRGKSRQAQVMAFDDIRAISTTEGVHPGLDPKELIEGKDGKMRQRYTGEKLKVWNDMQDGWKLLEKEGQEHYESMRTQYVEAFERLKENLLRAIKTVTGDNDEQTKEYRETLQGTIFKDLLEGTDIDPYFPLWRSGKFWVQYTATLDGQNETVYEAYDDLGERDARYHKLVAEGKKSGNDVIDKSVEQYEISSFKDFEKVPPTQFVKDSIEVLNKMDVDEETKNMLKHLYIQRLPETSFAKKLHPRTGSPGYVRDSLDTFRNTIFDLNRQTMQLRYGREIREKFDAFHKKADAFRDGHPENAATRAVADDLEREWSMRVGFAINPDSDWKATASRAANRIAFTGTIGFSPSSAFVNLSQIPMIAFPYLAGKTDMQTAYKSLNRASSLLWNAGREHTIQVEGEGGKLYKHKSFAQSIDNYYIRDTKANDKGVVEYRIRDDLEATAKVRKELEEILPMVQFMGDNAQLSRSLIYDTLGAEIGGKSDSIIDKGSAWSAWLFHITERTNRQIITIAAYLNELERLRNNPNTELKDADGNQIEVGLSDKQMKDLAVINGYRDGQYTNGGSILSTAPRWAQKNIGRVAMMFKSYGVTMYINQLELLHKSTKWGGKTKYERVQARRQLLGIQGGVALMSGIQGLTIYGLLATAINMTPWFDDDDEALEDFETITRKNIGEGLYKGLLNQLTRVLGGEGVDAAGRIGLSHLLIGSDRYNFDPSPEKSLIKALGGPFYGYTSQIGRGAVDIWEGEYQRGVENIMPAAFRNMMKAGRYLDEGEIRTRRGDPIMGDIGYGLLAAQFLGFAPAEYTRNQERAQVLKGIDRPVNEMRTKLLWLLYRADRFGENTDAIWEDIDEYNDKYPDNAIDGKAVANSRKRHMQTDPEMVNGVLLSPNNRAMLMDMYDGWDQGFQLFK